MKKSFTLVEVLMSVAIMSVLFLAMSNIIGNLKISKSVIKDKTNFEKKKEILIKVLYSDIINAKQFQIINKDKKFFELKLKTKNSLYDLIEPYVVWYVSKNQNSLIRTESYMPIKKDNFYYIDKFASNLDKFKIFKKNGKYFIYIGTKKPIYFEMYKGF